MLNAIRKFWSGLSALLLWQTPAESRIIHLKASNLIPRRRSAKFDHILIVEDIPRYAQASLDTIRQCYKDTDVTVYLSHTFAAALKAFQQYDINLVILDLDLDDYEGDGEMLLNNFRSQKTGITVLANSSEPRYNEILLAGGAAAVLSKDVRKLQKWLTDNG